MAKYDKADLERRIDLVVQFLQDQHAAARLLVLLDRCQGRPGADLFQQVVEPGQGQVDVFGLDRLARGVQLLPERAQAGFDRLRRVREGEGVEGTALIISRPIFQRPSRTKCPNCMYMRR